MKQYWLFLCYLFVFCGYGNAQIRQITGVVQNNYGEFLEGSTIVLEDINSQIISYAISAPKGLFQINYDVKFDRYPLVLTVSHIGHQNFVKKINVDEVLRYLQINLYTDSTLLQEIVVRKIEPIVKKQDTLSYRVQSFSKDEDRSIGDVLKRLPGITVDAEGAIYHNDKKIENLYIQGDDLMAGKYGLATRTIRKEMIERVDVIDHHQPIKVLEGKFLTDKVAVDLVLKDENSWKASFRGKLGLGLPSLYNHEFTGILLNKSLKIINQIGVNNASKDYTVDLIQLGGNGFGESLKENEIDLSMNLGLQLPDPLVAGNYYDNHSKVINLNNIVRFKNDLILKINTHFLKDRYLQQQSSFIRNLVDTGNVFFNESFGGVNQVSLFGVSASIQRNKPNGFINNTLSLNSENRNDFANTMFNTHNFAQNLANGNFSFSNDFNWLPSISNNHILEIRSYLSYNRRDKNLELEAGYRPFFIDSMENVIQNRYLQNLTMPRLYSDNYIAFKTFTEKVSMDFRVGIILDKLLLDSKLSAGGTTVENFVNNSDWFKKRYYFVPSFQYRSGKIRILSSFPVLYQRIDFYQKSILRDDTYLNFFALPKVNFQYQLNGENSVGLSYDLRNLSSDVQNLYSGNILQNFRNYSSNSTGFDVRNIHRFDFDYKNEKPLKMLFYGLKLSYTRLNFNTILEKKVNESGESFSLIPFSNTQHRYDIKNTFSKFFFDIGFTTKLSTGVGYLRSNLFLNSKNIPVTNVSPYISVSGTKRFGEFLELRYTPSFSYSRATFRYTNSDIEHNKQFVWRHDFSGFVKLFKFLQSSLDFNYVSYQQEFQPANNFYLFNLRNTIPVQLLKQKLDVNLNCFNILNVKKYSTYRVNQNSVSNQDFNLRGRMFTIDVNFYF